MFIAELTVVNLIQHHALTRIDVKMMLAEDLEQLPNILVCISWSDVSNVANVPFKLASTEGNEANVLEMIC